MKKYIFILIALLFTGPCVGVENGEESETIAFIDDSSDLQEVDETEELNEERHDNEHDDEETVNPDEELHEETPAPKQVMVTLSAETVKALRDLRDLRGPAQTQPRTQCPCSYTPMGHFDGYHQHNCSKAWPFSATRRNSLSPLKYQLNLANSTTMYAELTGTKKYHGGKH